MALIPNVAAGRIAYYTSLPLANDALVWILLQSAGLAADSALRDITTVGSLLAGATDEATFGGYARVVVTTGVSAVVDNANNLVTCDAPSPTGNCSSVQALGKILLAYDPDTTTGTDAALVPLFYDDFARTTPAVGTWTYNVNAAGFARAVPQ